VGPELRGDQLGEVIGPLVGLLLLRSLSGVEELVDLLLAERATVGGGEAHGRWAGGLAALDLGDRLVEGHDPVAVCPAVDVTDIAGGDRPGLSALPELVGHAACSSNGS
jgi:hypothetical protein